MIRDCLAKLSRNEPLTEAEAWDATLEIFEGKAAPAQVGAYLTFLAAKGETAEEVLGSMKAMREKMVRLDVGDLNPIDVCGTGGDHKGTFNISTTAALVLAGGGVVVAKHGNRAASSQCGSAEVLDALGVKIDPTPLVLEKCLREAGIAFLFAPHFHPAMKNVGPLRKELGFRTIFNLLGPLCNPASVKTQVIGVYDPAKAQLMGEALLQAGSQRVVTLHSQDGLDEVSCAAPTSFWEYRASHPVRTLTLGPSDFGFEPKPLEFIHGSDAAANARILTGILEGEKGPYRDAVAMNAAVGFYVAGKCQSIPEGRALAEESIDSKKALKALQKLEQISHS
ncbi:MAG TPA: anthranilate phosphoribosyltransferase [bacterium]|nr:anthranilate phosphoribosyltransferase [bacterium]